MSPGLIGRGILPIRVLAPVAALVVVLLAAGSAQAATCSSAPPTVTVTLNSGETATIGTSAGTITLNNVACTGAPTTANTDTINVNGTTGNETAVFDLTNGPFAPGATPEASGASEIEINVNLGLSSADRITVTGSSAAENFNLGSDGINLNGDDDADILFGTNTELFTVNGAGGNDVISAQGDAGTGSPLTLPATLNGDTGDDTFEPGFGNDTIAGGLGTADLIDATDAPGPVTINLATTSAQNTGALGVNTITGVEDLIGSAFADTMTGDGASNSLNGAGGDDRLNGAAGDDTLDGGPGTDTGDYSTATAALTVSLSLGTQDTLGSGIDTLSNLENLTGGTGNDTLVGDSGSNLLRGGAGNDVLEGRAGDDQIDGDAGTDTASALNAPGPVTIDLRSSTLTGADGSDALSEVESGLGSSFDDSLIGDDAANTLNGSAGIDTVDYSQAIGGVTLNLASDSASGAGGTDIVTQVEWAIGSPFDDSLSGGPRDNRLHGEGGSDILVGAGGDDSLDGGPGIDTASYSASSAPVSADLGAGTASGATGDDTLANLENLIGGTSDDTLRGDSARNELNGGTGFDTVAGRGGDDSLDGGSDIDTVDFSSSDSAVKVNLGHQRSTGEGADAVAGFENVRGSAQGDTLTGDTQANVLEGGAGPDVLIGAIGNDSLEGGSGTDTADYSGIEPTGFGVGVSVDLARGHASAASADTDSLEAVENLIGSSFDDVIDGSGEANRIEAGAGDDAVDGMGGRDIVRGDAGKDRLALGLGKDRGFGGGGGDRLKARDGDRDRVDGGGGIDSARVDRGEQPRDRVKRVEKVS